MVLRASVSACISLCASMRIPQTDSAAGPQLRVHLYALPSAGVEAMVNNITLLEEKLVNIFGGSTAIAERVEFTATVTQKKIERHPHMIKCDITWTESSGTLTQGLVTARAGKAGEETPFLRWGDEDDAGMKRTTFNFRPDQFPKIPSDDDEWKDIIVSSTAGIEKSKIVIGRISHAGIDFTREYFETDVFWWRHGGEQINRFHHDDVLLLSGEEVHIKKIELEFDLADATKRMPTTDGAWEALIANMAGVTHIHFMRIIQKGLIKKKTKFGCTVYWVGNNGGRAAVGNDSDDVPAFMLDDASLKKTTFIFRPSQFTAIPNNDYEWKDLIVSTTVDVKKTDIIIGKIRPVGLDFSREVFQVDVFWCDEKCDQTKVSKQIQPVANDDDQWRSGQEIQVTAVQFAVMDAAETMPTTDEEWEVLIKNMKKVTHVEIVKIVQKGLNERKTTFGCDVYWV